MARTPNRDAPGALREDEELQLASNPGTPSVAGAVRYDGVAGTFRLRDGYGTFDPRSSAGVNTALSNLTSTSINAALIPAINDGYDIGSSSLRWQDGYFTALHTINGIRFNDGSIQTTATVSQSSSASEDFILERIKETSTTSGTGNFTLDGAETGSITFASVFARHKVTFGVATASTANATSYATGSFTPAAGDVLVALVVASGTVATGTMSDSQSLVWKKIAQARRGASVDTLYAFISDGTTAASSMTATFDCTGDAATGAVVTILRVTGTDAVGFAAVLQAAIQENQTTATPAPAFSSVTLSKNTLIGLVGNASSPASLSPPASWTEHSDTGYSTPTTGSEVASLDDGYAGLSAVWGSVSSTDFAAIALEINSNLFRYVITDGTNTESGKGYLNAAGALVRYQVLRSTNSNTLVSFGAGTKFVRVDRSRVDDLSFTSTATKRALKIVGLRS